VGGERLVQVVGEEDDVEGPLAGAQVERVGQAIVDDGGGGRERHGPGSRRGVRIPGPVGVESAKAGDEIGPGEGEVVGLGQRREGSAGLGIERGDGLREMGVDSAAQFLGYLSSGVTMMGGHVVNGGQRREGAPGIVQQAGDGIHQYLRNTRLTSVFLDHLAASVECNSWNSLASRTASASGCNGRRRERTMADGLWTVPSWTTFRVAHTAHSPDGGDGVGTFSTVKWVLFRLTKTEWCRCS